MLSHPLPAAVGLHWGRRQAAGELRQVLWCLSTLDHSLLTFSPPAHIPQGQPAWSPWTPWSMCSASCSPARRHRHRFCIKPSSMAPFTLAPLPTAALTALCPGSEAEEEPCVLPGCDRKWPFRLMLALTPWVGPSLVYLILVPAGFSTPKPFHTVPSSAVPSEAGSWSPWGPWSGCSRSCGGGLRSRTRACDQPPPQGLGDFCEGPQAQGEACQAQPCPGSC